MKLSLGTAQLGVAYGVNNAVGYLSDVQADAVLDAAADSGFTMVDTSADYGPAMERIGRFLQRRPGTLSVVGKFSGALPHEAIRELKRHYNAIVPMDHTLLWTSGAQDIASLNSSLANGVTVYTVEDAEAVSDDFSMVQVPASVLDGRMDDEILQLQAKGKTVQVRSLLLQGLLAADPETGPVGHHQNPKLPEAARPYLLALNILANARGISVVELAVRWAYEINPDVAIIGAETPEQVRAIGKAWKRGPLPEILVRALYDMRIGVPEVVISPRMWAQAFNFTTEVSDE